MNRLISSFSLLFLLVACQEQAKNSTTADIRPPVQAADTIRLTVLNNTAAAITGDWLSAAYWDSVRLYHSPFRVRGAAEGFTALTIRLDSGALALWPGYANHEGGVPSHALTPASTLPVRVQPSLNGSESNTSYSILSWQIEVNDSLLRIQSFERPSKSVGTRYFRRVLRRPNTGDDMGVGLQYMLRTTLFAGAFTGADSANRRVNVRFSPNGQIQGIPPFRSFDVQADFVMLPNNNFDQLFLTASPSKTRRLTYVFRGDSLYLFSAKTALTPDSLEVLQPGRLLYALIRRI